MPKSKLISPELEKQIFEPKLKYIRMQEPNIFDFLAEVPKNLTEKELKKEGWLEVEEDEIVYLSEQDQEKIVLKYKKKNISLSDVEKDLKKLQEIEKKKDLRALNEKIFNLITKLKEENPNIKVEHYYSGHLKIEGLSYNKIITEEGLKEIMKSVGQSRNNKTYKIVKSKSKLMNKIIDLVPYHYLMGIGGELILRLYQLPKKMSDKDLLLSKIIDLDKLGEYNIENMLESRLNHMRIGKLDEYTYLAEIPYNLTDKEARSYGWKKVTKKQSLYIQNEKGSSYLKYKKQSFHIFDDLRKLQEFANKKDLLAISNKMIKLVKELKNTYPNILLEFSPYIANIEIKGLMKEKIITEKNLKPYDKSNKGRSRTSEIVKSKLINKITNLSRKHYFYDDDDRLIIELYKGKEFYYYDEE